MNKLDVMNNGFKIKPFAPNLGAVITNVDLSNDINDEELKGIIDAFYKYQVLFFQNQIASHRLELPQQNHNFESYFSIFQNHYKKNLSAQIFSSFFL